MSYKCLQMHEFHLELFSTKLTPIKLKKQRQYKIQVCHNNHIFYEIFKKHFSVLRIKIMGHVA